MVNFTQLKRVKCLTATIVFIKYSLWCFFFILQGKAIDLAIEKNKLYKQLVYTLSGYIFIKIMVMLCDIVQKFITEYYKNSELQQQWNKKFPKTIYRDNKNHQSHINIIFFDYLPKLFDLEVAIITNKVTLYYIFSLTIAAFLYTRFFIGILALSLVFLLNYLSKNIFTQQINEYQIATNASKIKILTWVNQYFSAYREISKNWQPRAISSWKNNIYKEYFLAKNKQLLFYLYRDLWGQLLVELPFLCNTAVVILGVYYGHLSLTQLFVWVGFAQFMINASNAYLENRAHQKQSDTLHSQTHMMLCDFSCENSEKKWPINSTTKKPFFTEIFMRDGTKNTVALTPGIYPIKGGNGSGKSTLMNIILAYERKYSIFENSDLAAATFTIKQDNIRIIERDAVVFECLDNFNSQICGPLQMPGARWKEQIKQSIRYLLEPHLVKQWENIFMFLEAAYNNRKDQTLSSGEKVILSFMRFFASWNKQVSLLIIDECDTFLDPPKKRIFREALHNLASHMAIYISSHSGTAPT